METWALISPIPFYTDEEKAIGAGIEMGHGLVLQAAPDWFSSSLMGLDPNEQLTSSQSRFVLLCRYEAEGLGEVDPWGGVVKDSPHARARDLIASANLAFWISRPSELRTATLLHYRNPGTDPGPVLFVRRASPRISEEEHSVSLSTTELESARLLFGALVTLPRNNAVWIALRMLHKAIHDPMWEVRLVFMWTALEGLFGPRGGGELKYRLGLRLAAFAGVNDASRQDIFRTSKRSYDIRSAVVHGDILAPSTDTHKVAQETATLVRRTASKVLGNTQMISRFIGNDRDAYLDGLVLGTRDN